MRYVAALTFAVIACGEKPSARDDSASATTRPKQVATPAAPADSAPNVPSPPTVSAAPACVLEGEWQPCRIEKRLTDAGFVPIKKGAAPAGVFDVEGITYALGAAELHVYLFPSATERESGVAAIDTVTVTRGAGPSPWSMQPTLITSNNLVAVLLSDNGRLIERVQNAITAGLPSAPH